LQYHYAAGTFARNVQRRHEYQWQFDPDLQKRALRHSPRGKGVLEADQQQISLQLFLGKLQDPVQGLPMAMAHAGRSLCTEHQQWHGEDSCLELVLLSF
jgi:hypothetical protein